MKAKQHVKRDTSRAWQKYYDRAYINKSDNKRLKELAERKHSSIPNMITSLLDVYMYMEKQESPLLKELEVSDGPI